MVFSSYLSGGGESLSPPEDFLQLFPRGRAFPFNSFTLLLELCGGGKREGLIFASGGGRKGGNLLLRLAKEKRRKKCPPVHLSAGGGKGPDSELLPSAPGPLKKRKKVSLLLPSPFSPHLLYSSCLKKGVVIPYPSSCHSSPARLRGGGRSPFLVPLFLSFSFPSRQKEE